MFLIVAQAHLGHPKQRLDRFAEDEGLFVDGFFFCRLFFQVGVTFHQIRQEFFDGFTQGPGLFFFDLQGGDLLTLAGLQVKYTPSFGADRADGDEINGIELDFLVWHAYLIVRNGWVGWGASARNHSASKG